MPTQLLVSTRKGLFVFGRDDGSWQVQRSALLGENVTLALADGKDWYAALNHGHFGVKLRHSADQGQTWEERAVPAYPPGEMLTTGDGKPPQPANLKLIWALERGNGALWAGTLPGGLFRSADNAVSWNLVRGLWDRPERPGWFGGGADAPGIHSVCVDPRDAKVMRVAVSTGGTWQTDDGGETWQQTGEGMFAEYMPPEQRFNPAAQDVHRMVQCPASPDRLWIQHHNGVFRSDDGGLRWQEIKARPSAFGFAVAVHPRDPDTAWFVPAVKDETRIPVDARFVISRTRDGGQTFDVLTKGLPEGPAYDIVYRHALAVDATGERVAAGSTTGGLWVSENQGDSWQLLSAHLPPIHAVTFA